MGPKEAEELGGGGGDVEDVVVDGGGGVDPDEVLVDGGGGDDVAAARTSMLNFWPELQCVPMVQMKWKSPTAVRGTMAGLVLITPVVTFVQASY